MKFVFLNNSILACCFLLISNYSQAACKFNSTIFPRNITVPSAVINVQFDSPNGVLTYQPLRYAYTGETTIGKNGTSCGTSSLISEWLGGWNTANNNTGISGVKLELNTFQNPIGSTISTYYNSPGRVITSNAHWHFRLYKTGQILQSGYIKSGQVARVFQRNTSPVGVYNLSTLSIAPNSVFINVIKCSIKNNQSNYNIKLGDYYDTQFKKSGYSGAMVNIPITLTCMAGANIKVKVTSSNGYINASNGELALSGSNKANGIAIQLLDKNNNPIKLNTQFSLQDNVPKGDYMFNWKARYRSTSDNVTPGQANSNANILIRYE